jgi:hypothetical protein
LDHCFRNLGGTPQPKHIAAKTVHLLARKKMKEKKRKRLAFYSSFQGKSTMS